jgi:hypothetical protein
MLKSNYKGVNLTDFRNLRDKMMMHLSQKNKERAKKEHNVIYSNTNNT